MNVAIIPAPVLVLARGFYYASALLLFGDLAFSLLIRTRLPIVLPPKEMRARWSALVAAAAASLVWLVMAAQQMAGTLNESAVIQTITATLFGQLLLARIAAMTMLALVLQRGGKLAVLLALVVLILPSGASHAAAASPAGFMILGASLDALHLATAGFWIGGLAVLLQLFRRKEPNIILVLSLFSDWAMIAVLLLAMSGLIDGASILLGDKGTPSLSYLAVLGTKLALVAGMLGLAGINRFHLIPQNQDQRVARNAALELVAGFIVVLLAGALGQLQPTL